MEEGSEMPPDVDAQEAREHVAALSAHRKVQRLLAIVGTKLTPVEPG